MADRQTLLSLLLPQHTSLKKEVEDKLDETVIRQQAEAGTMGQCRAGSSGRRGRSC